MNDLALQAKTDEKFLENIFAEMESACHYLSNQYASWMLPKEDLLQQCRVEIWQAVLAYQPERGDFKSFCFYFLKRRLQSHVRVMVYRKKHQPFRQAKRLNKVAAPDSSWEDDRSWEEIIASEQSAENKAIKNESVRVCNQILRDQLTPIEFTCVRMFYFDNVMQKEIGPILGLSPKTADNALQRAKKKLRANVELQEIYEAVL